MSKNNLLGILSLLFVLFMSSCSQKYCDLITQSLEKQCNIESKECVVSFKETFDLSWDTLYIFDSMLYPDEVSSVIGLEYKGNIVPEGESLFVFVQNNNIVKEQVSQCSGILFINLKDDGVVKIVREESYTMRRKTVHDKTQYLLYPKK